SHGPGRRQVARRPVLTHNSAKGSSLPTQEHNEVAIMADELISKAEKARISRLDNIDSAFVMLSLVNQFHTEHLDAFSRGLILAICWEESFFQNIPQLGGPAVGYGQLEVDGRRIANQHFTGDPVAGEGAFNGPAILASRETSIRAVSHCLAGLFERLGNSK